MSKKTNQNRTDRHRLMGRIHTNGYKRLSDFFPEYEYVPVLQACCSRKAERAQAFADQWGYKSIETDWRKVIERDDIDAVDICTPNDSHAEIAIAAAKAGKMILCEKPLARTVDEAEEMLKAVEAAGVKNTVWYNYRRVPAVTLAKKHCRFREAWEDFSLPGQLPAGLDDQS